MTDTPSPTPEEIEAAARAIRNSMIKGDADMPAWENISKYFKSSYLKHAEAALKAAMAVRRGKEIVSPSLSFKEGQIVTGVGLVPHIVTIAKDGTIVLVPKEAKTSRRGK
jgi:hypothetical protein